MIISESIQKYYFSQEHTNSIAKLKEFIHKNSEDDTIEFLDKNFKSQKGNYFIDVLYTAFDASYYNLFSELLDHIPEGSREALLNTNIFAQMLITRSLPLALCKKLDLCGWNPAYFNQPDRFGVTLLAKLAGSGNGEALFFHSIINRIGIENVLVTGSPNFDKTELYRCLNTKGEEVLSKLKTGSKEPLPLIVQHGCTITIPQENGSLLKLYGLTIARVLRYLTGHGPASQSKRDWQRFLIADSLDKQHLRNNQTGSSGTSTPIGMDTAKQPQGQKWGDRVARDFVAYPPGKTGSCNSRASHSKKSTSIGMDTTKQPQGQKWGGRAARDLIAHHPPGEKSSCNSRASFFETRQAHANERNQTYPVAQAIWKDSSKMPEKTDSLQSHVWFRTHVAPHHGYLSIQDPNTGNLNVFGLYPEGDSSKFQKLGRVPCQIIDDSYYHQSMKEYDAVITTQFLIPSEKAKNIFKHIELMKNDCQTQETKYSILGGNCIDFIQSVYKNANLSIVKNFGDFITPHDFARFISLDPSWLPIQYAMLRSHGIMSTITANLPGQF
ncbi:MAG TPA: hypothetical protein VLE95_06460 [Chlamydiales bacterium]|nr:hypothetical protein [Chlamydiales bacterium]